MNTYPVPTTSAICRLIAAAWLFALPGAAPALPTGENVVAGDITVSRPGRGNASVAMTTNSGIVEWQDFSIGFAERVNFQMPGAGSAVLNRVTGGDPSSILGQLTSNGRVFLINRSGILFGENATVDTAGFVASTLNITNADFTGQQLRFSGGMAGSIQNAGRIQSSGGGFIYLISPNITNTGVIAASQGDVVLAGGTEVILAEAEHPALRVQVSTPAGQTLNLGQILADGGTVGLAGAAIRQAGIVSANCAVSGGRGEVYLSASQGLELTAGGVTRSEGGRVSAMALGGDLTGAGTIASASATLTASGSIGSTNTPLAIAVGEVQGAAGGDIRLTSAGSLNIGDLQCGRDLSVTSPGDVVGSGSISAHWVDLAAGGSVSLNHAAIDHLVVAAGGGITISNSKPLEVRADDSGGNLSIQATGGLVGIRLTAAGSVNIASTGGPLSIGAGGITAGTGIHAATGSGTGNDGLTINGDLKTTAGNISVVSGGSVLQNANLTVDGAGGISVTAATGNIEMAPGIVSSSTGGTFTYSALGNVVLAHLDAGAEGAVSVWAGNGGIVPATPGGVNVVAGGLTAQAAGQILLGVDVPREALVVSSLIGFVYLTGPDGVPLTAAPPLLGGPLGGGTTAPIFPDRDLFTADALNQLLSSVAVERGRTDAQAVADDKPQP